MEKPIPNVGSAKGVVSYIVGRTYAQADAAGFGAGARGSGTPAPRPTVVAGGRAVPSALSGSASSAPSAAAARRACCRSRRRPRCRAEVPTVELVQRRRRPTPLTEISFYPLLVALVPILLIAAVAARRFV